MKHVKDFVDWVQFLTDPLALGQYVIRKTAVNDIELIKKINKGKASYRLRKDGSIDVKGNIDISHKKLTKIPVKFNIVNGDFICYENMLTTLENAPKIITGKFWCSDNKLRNLEHCPLEVRSNNFDFVHNNFPKNVEEEIQRCATWQEVLHKKEIIFSKHANIKKSLDTGLFDE
jgi:hypothetical protein